MNIVNFMLFSCVKIEEIPTTEISENYERKR